MSRIPFREPAVCVAVGLVILLCSCSAGQAVPGAPFPPRPRDIRVADLPACDALNAGQTAALGVRDSSPDVLTRGENSCAFTGDKGEGWTIRMDPGISARIYVPGEPGYGGEEAGIRDSRVVTVAGYGAVELEYGPAEYTYNCSLVVDAAPDTSFLVTYSDSSPDSRLPSADSRPQRCAQAARAAEMVIATARARG